MREKESKKERGRGKSFGVEGKSSERSGRRKGNGGGKDEDEEEEKK